jgi:hypothetical protein
MFEQATLVSGPAGKRVWSAFLGVTTQVVLVSGVIVAPMIWPQIMPRAQLLATFLPPVPPGPHVFPEQLRKALVQVGADGDVALVALVVAGEFAIMRPRSSSG